MESLTLTLSGNSSVLDANYFPPIELSVNKNYALGLIQLSTFNSVPNVDFPNNKFYVGDRTITIPTGSYEIEDIEKYLKNQNIQITIKPNNNTLKCSIICDEIINFEPYNSIADLLGFTHRKLLANKEQDSDLPVSILKINSIRIECNITTDAYINNQKVHTIHEFFPCVPPGFKVVEAPSNVIYLPISTRVIDHLQIRIIDQDQNLVNFRGETITIRLHIKSL